MSGGFDCEFVEKPPEAVPCKCPICLLVLREPYQGICCGKSFCKECIHRIKATNQVCPMCNKGDITIFPNLGLQQSLYDFQVYCTHKSKGCEWTGELRELDNHLNSDPPADKALQGCTLTFIKCPLSCGEDLQRKNYKNHINDNIDKLVGLVVGQAALMKSIEQENTQLKTRLASMEGDKQYLEQLVVELEAKIGEQDKKYKRLESKNEELEMREMERQLKEMRGQLSRNEGDKQHLEQQVTELLTKVTKLDEKFQELEMKNGELESEVKLKQPVIASSPQSGQPTSPDAYVTGTYKPIGAEFTMTNFEEYRRDNDDWFSSHFYTHPNGYKLYLLVNANGFKRDKGTYLSVCVCLMRGEYDDQLRWPFRGDITIKLVNQEEDENHHVRIAQYLRSIPEVAYARVVKEERSYLGWGIPQFLPLTELQPKYLKNNCIKLCVTLVHLF